MLIELTNTIGTPFFLNPERIVQGTVQGDKVSILTELGNSLVLDMPFDVVCEKLGVKRLNPKPYYFKEVKIPKRRETDE